MFRQYYPNVFMSPEPVDAGGTSDAYDESITIDNEVIEVHVESQGEGKKPLVYPKGEYAKWGEPEFAKKLTDQLVHNSKKAMEVLKNNNESTKAMQELQAKFDESEKQRLRNEVTIEVLQTKGTPPKEDKKPDSETKVFDEKARAYEIAGISNDDEWDDLTPSQRFNAQTKASGEHTNFNQLQMMNKFNTNNAKVNQQFQQEQRLGTLIVQAGLEPQTVKAEMEAIGISYSETGVNHYINSLKSNQNPKPKGDAIDELNKRNEIINRSKSAELKGAQSGFEFVTPESKRLQQFEKAVKGSKVDKNQKAREALGLK